MLALASAGQSSDAYIDELFSAYTYTGAGTPKTITNGIDIAGKGAMVWFKNRTNGYSHYIFDTVRGIDKPLFSDQTAAQATGYGAVTAFSSTGFSLETGYPGTNLDANNNYVSWTFAKGARFFDVQTKSHTNGVADSIDLSVLGTVGMVVVKRTDSTSSWFVWHRNFTSGKLAYLQATSLETSDTSISVSGTTLTLAAALPTGSYVIYAWAHDTAPAGVIQCGTMTDVSGSGATVTLGFEPQFIMWKVKSGSGGGDWRMADTMRDLSQSNTEMLSANTSAVTSSGSTQVRLTATGFIMRPGSMINDADYVYMAVRRPNKPPTNGQDVYHPALYTGNGASSAVVSGAGFAPSLLIAQPRNALTDPTFWDRSRGAYAGYLKSNQTTQEAGGLAGLLSFNQDGVTVADLAGHYLNGSGAPYIFHFLKRAPGFLDVVAYTGTGGAHAEPHNLGAVPELMIVKRRGALADQWDVYHAALGATKYILLNSTATTGTAPTWNDLAPTSTAFNLGSNADNNGAGGTYIAYLFATLAGISKVFSYTGNGTSQTINCGFASGARFVLIKRTDVAGDWFFWDTARGIVAGNDPHLSLNTAVAEVTTDDSIDPSAAGFIVNQIAATGVNVNGGSYIGMAIA